MNNVRGRNVQAIVGAFLLGASSLIGGQIAFAGGSPPTPVSWTVDLPIDWLAPGECPFPIRVSVSGKGGTITLPGNRSIVTAPGQNAVVMNLNNGKTVTLNVTGAFHVSTDQDDNLVTVVTGRNMLGDPEAGFVLAIGTFSYIFDSGGNLVQPLTGKGQLISVCEMID